MASACACGKQGVCRKQQQQQQQQQTTKNMLLIIILGSSIVHVVYVSNLECICSSYPTCISKEYSDRFCCCRCRRYHPHKIARSGYLHVGDLASGKHYCDVKIGKNLAQSTYKLHFCLTMQF